MQKILIRPWSRYGPRVRCMACENSGLTVGAQARCAGCRLLVVRYLFSESCAVGALDPRGGRRLALGRPCSQAGWLPDDAEAVDVLPTPDPDAKGAIYSLGRSETLKKFHSHVLPLSGEKA